MSVGVPPFRGTANCLKMQRSTAADVHGGSRGEGIDSIREIDSVGQEGNARGGSRAGSMWAKDECETQYMWVREVLAIGLYACKGYL